VRNLKKHLEKIYRKAAFKLVQNGAKLVAVEPAAAADADKQQQDQEQEPTAAAAAAADATASPADSSSSSSSPDTAESSSSSSSSGSGSSTLQVIYEGDPIKIGDSDLKEYVGLPPFAQDKFYDTTPSGVVMGLAWTAMGGATLYVEAAPIVDVSGPHNLISGLCGRQGRTKRLTGWLLCRMFAQPQKVSCSAGHHSCNVLTDGWLSA
jgi:Lon-like ATP-dependent protease